MASRERSHCFQRRITGVGTRDAAPAKTIACQVESGFVNSWLSTSRLKMENTASEENMATKENMETCDFRGALCTLNSPQNRRGRVAQLAEQLTLNQ